MNAIIASDAWAALQDVHQDIVMNSGMVVMQHLLG